MTTAQGSVDAGSILIAPGTLLPPEWLLEDHVVASGWSRLTNTLDRLHREKALRAGGWSFFFLAGAITATSAGWSRPKMLDAALARLMGAVKRQGCNCLEIDDVRVRSFLGVPYTRVSAHPRHIQKGMFFSGQ